MSPAEIRMRCIEAAAKNPVPHPEGFVAGVLAAAKLWEQWINGGEMQAMGEAYALATGKKTLGLPKKGGKVSDLL